MNHYIFFAQAYGESAYGDCTYSPDSSRTCTTTSTGSTNPSTGGGLAGTGADIVLIVSIACALLFAGLIVRALRRKNPVASERK